MPVAAINVNPSHLAADSSNDTPADLPSERARFADELGRETALVGPPLEPEESAKVGPDQVPSEEAVAANEEASKEVDADDDTASDPVDDADELTQMLTLLGLAVPPAAATVLSTVEVLPSGSDDPGKSVTADVIPLAMPLQDAGASAAPPTQRGPMRAQGEREAAAAPATDAAALQAEPMVLTVPAEPLPAAASSAASAAAVVADLTSLDEDAPGTTDDVAARVLEQVRFHAAFEAAGAAPKGAAATNAAGSAKLPAGTGEPGRSVALAELPRAMLHAVDTFVRMRSRGGRWEAQIRLDPPELGTLHVRLELDGDAVRGVVHYADRRLEPELGRVFQQVEESLRQQGGDASFELKQRAQEEERERGTAAFEAREADSVPVLAAGRAPGSPRPDPRRLVDLLA